MTEDKYFDHIKAVLTLSGIPDIETVIEMRKSVLDAGYEPSKLLIPRIYVLGMPVEFASIEVPRIEFK